MNVALGFPTLSDYVDDFENQPWPAPGGSGQTYFGGIVGRYANRIANASFTLNGDRRRGSRLRPPSRAAARLRPVEHRCAAVGR